MTTCTTCGELAARVTVDLQEGEQLPVAVGRLEERAGGKARRCPDCGAWFLYTDDFEYQYPPLGYGWERATIERVERDRVIEVLGAAAVDGERAP